MKRLLTTSVMILLAMFTFLQAENSTHLSMMSITDTNGKKYIVKGTDEGLIFEGLEGRVVFIEFFGHNCPPCIASIPHLISLQEKHKDKLTIIAVEVQNYTDKEVKLFAKDKGINYITVAGSNADRFIQYISQRAEWSGSIPFTLAMDIRGDVQFVQVGMIPEETLDGLVEELSKVKEVKEVKKVEDNKTIKQK